MAGLDEEMCTLGEASICVHVGSEPDPVYGAVSAPIYQTSTFAFPSPEVGAARFDGRDPGFVYTRLGNPTVCRLEQCVAALEKAKYGLATATGMAAVTVVYTALLSSGDHLLGSECLYGPSRGVIETEFSRFGITSSFVDTSKPELVAASFKPNTKVLYLESPANPTLQLCDITVLARIAHEHGVVVVVDNTFASPILQNPLTMGADVVLHSTTKFINGHADLIGGIICTNRPEIYAALRRIRSSFGYSMEPLQAWLCHRGCKTLPLRVRAQQENAMQLAEMLEHHPAVGAVHYPGLRSHPQYELACRQMSGPGSVISFELKGGVEAGVRGLKACKMIACAVSLGGVESLIEHPASMTHHGLPREARLAAGVTDGLVRLAVGIESIDDLKTDLLRVLEAAMPLPAP